MQFVFPFLWIRSLKGEGQNGTNAPVRIWWAGGQWEDAQNPTNHMPLCLIAAGGSLLSGWAVTHCKGEIWNCAWQDPTCFLCQTQSSAFWPTTQKDWKHEIHLSLNFKIVLRRNTLSGSPTFSKRLKTKRNSQWYVSNTKTKNQYYLQICFISGYDTWGMIYPTSTRFFVIPNTFGDNFKTLPKRSGMLVFFI